MRTLYQQDYRGFTIKHLHEKLEQRHGYKLGYTTTQLCLQKTGAVPPAPRRGAHRRKRPRRPMRGMLLHQDGSKHAWLADQPPGWCGRSRARPGSRRRQPRSSTRWSP